ncbi:hypothetical protein BGZ65_004202 [Modicella reniformis]|uniref:Uncharacterized protein n=1 Tax=Modicella reniformis TaxID=1440133 RepID=A0A9P6MH15_9FUNG|nr:hypothetical protein BGZ65_004202 [Modicella reniformis]
MVHLRVVGPEDINFEDINFEDLTSSMDDEGTRHLNSIASTSRAAANHPPRRNQKTKRIIMEKEIELKKVTLLKENELKKGEMEEKEAIRR